MKTSHRIIFGLYVLLFALCPAIAADEPIPSNSVYQLAMPLTNQDGKLAELINHRGEPLLITMFYSSCSYVCPRIIEAT